MSHTDPEILALRALGQRAGSAEDDAHTAQCADCQRELDRLSHVVDIARTDGPAPLEHPPPALWARIAAATGVDAAPPAAASVAVPSAAGNGAGPARPDSGRGRQGDAERPAPAPPARPDRSPRRGRRRLRVAVAAATAGLVIGVGGTVAVVELTRPAASAVVADIALRPLPQFPQWRTATGTAQLRETPSAQQLAVSVSAPRRTGFYEVWLLGRDGTSMISLGDLNAADTGTFTLPAGVDLRFYSRVDVSLQPFNGSTLHSSTSVVRGSLPSSGG